MVAETSGASVGSLLVALFLRLRYQGVSPALPLGNNPITRISSNRLPAFQTAEVTSRLESSLEFEEGGGISGTTGLDRFRSCRTISE